MRKMEIARRVHPRLIATAPLALLLAGIVVASALAVERPQGHASAVPRLRPGLWAAAPKARVARYEVGAARIGDAAYIVGGIAAGSSEPAGTFERYDLRTGRSRLLAPLPVGTSHAGVVAYRGNVYVAGGNPDAGDQNGPKSATADLYRYDVRRNRWTKLAPMPLGIRGGAAAGVIGDKLYIAGGAAPRADGSGSDTLATLEIYDFRSNTWSRGADMPAGRTHVGGAVVGGRLYLIGGSTAVGISGQTVQSMESYDPRTNSWRSEPELPRGHWAFGTVVIGGKIFVVGGIGSGSLGFGSLSARVEVYDPATRRWSTMPGMRTARHHFAAVSQGDRIWTFGGTTDAAEATQSKDVEVLEIPRATPTTRLVPFTASIAGSQIRKSGEDTTMVGAFVSKLFGASAVVVNAKATTTRTDGFWAIYTARGAIFAKVTEFPVLSGDFGPPGGGPPEGGPPEGGPPSDGPVTLEGVGAITSGTERYRGVSGWFDIDETVDTANKSATLSVNGTLMRPKG